VNHKLACSCGRTDVVAAHSAVIMYRRLCWWWPTLGVLALHGGAAEGALTNCAAILWRRPTALTTTRLSYCRGPERWRATGVHCVA
jgi:hypothetical protein